MPDKSQEIKRLLSIAKNAIERADDATGRHEGLWSYIGREIDMAMKSLCTAFDYAKECEEAYLAENKEGP